VGPRKKGRKKKEEESTAALFLVKKKKKGNTDTRGGRGKIDFFVVAQGKKKWGTIVKPRHGKGSLQGPWVVEREKKREENSVVPPGGGCVTNMKGGGPTKKKTSIQLCRQGGGERKKRGRFGIFYGYGGFYRTGEEKGGIRNQGQNRFGGARGANPSQFPVQQQSPKDLILIKEKGTPPFVEGGKRKILLFSFGSESGEKERKGKMKRERICPEKKPASSP